ITLLVRDATGAVIRHLSSAPIAAVPEAARPPHPNFWVATPTPLPKNTGANRTNWDLRRDAPRSFSHSFEINANPGLTPASPEGPVAPPGTYTLELTMDGARHTKTVIVKPDPRSPATPTALVAQGALQAKLAQAADAAYDGSLMAATLRDAL